MTTYVIEDKIINIKSGATNTYYFAKDDHVHTFADYCEGYKTKGHALKRLEKEINEGYQLRKLDEVHALESEKWLHIYKIVEIEEKA